MPPVTMTADDAALYDAANLRAICRCQSCREMFPRSEMSVYDGICPTCLAEHYIICTLCGRLVDHWHAAQFDMRERTYGHVIGDVYASDGRPCCYTCYNSTRRNDRWRPTPLDVSIATYDKVGSTRKFGVEIETSCCPEHAALKGHTFFGAKSDPTVGGLEFDSPILYGDEGFAEIRKLLAYADRNGWEVDGRCGCHAHFDMRDETEDQLWATYYAYNRFYPMWAATVPSRRHDGSYCHEPVVSGSDIVWSFDNCDGDDDGDFRTYAYDADRYEYLNIVAYDDHRTFEVRLLDGTIHADTICNWVALHARFIDRVHNMSFAEIRELGTTRSKLFKSLVKLIDDAPLTDWLAQRARYRGSNPLRGPHCVS